MPLLKPIPYKLKKFKVGEIVISNGKVGVCGVNIYLPNRHFMQAYCSLVNYDSIKFDGSIIIDEGARRANKFEREYFLKKLKDNGFDISFGLSPDGERVIIYV